MGGAEGGLHRVAGHLPGPSEAAARDALTQFAASPLGQKHTPIVVLWERHWAHIAPAFADPIPIRRVLYTTTAIESLHLPLGNILKTPGHFPTDDAASTLRYLSLRALGTTWKERPDNHWRAAFSHLTLLFGDR